MYVFNKKTKNPEEALLKSLLPQMSRESLEEEIYKALAKQNRKIISLCLNTLTLPHLTTITNTKNAREMAKNEACYLPKPTYLNRMSLLLAELPSPNIFKKTAKYTAQTLEKALLLDLDSPPQNNWAAQNQINLAISLMQGCKWVLENLYALLGSKLKTACVASSILLSLGGIRLFYKNSNIGVPEVINKEQMVNLSRKAEEGSLKKTIGRSEEIQRLIIALTPTPIEKPKIAFLLGPPGVGKTQLVEGLALKIAEGMVPTLQGKRLFSVNTANLAEQGSYNENGYRSRLDLIFKEIQGYEQNIILFFDEAHNAASNSMHGTESEDLGRGLLIEQLKTRLLERNILAILATTEEEYTRFIAPNKAFVERTEVIPVPPLGDSETTLVLQDAIEKESIKITQSALEETLKIGRSHESYKQRANPRKSFDILQKAVKHVISWSPISLQKKIETKEIEWSSLKSHCCIKAEQIPDWMETSEGKENLHQLKALEQEIARLKTSLKTETAALQSIAFLRTLETSSFKKHCEFVHLLADPDKKKDSEMEKSYIFYRQILLPCIRKQLKEKVEAFENEYREKIPLFVDKETLQELFKS